MKKITVYITILAAMFFMGCTEDFEDINTDPSAANQPPIGAFFNPILQRPVFGYQRNINLFEDSYSQYWSNTNSNFESSRYEYVDGWIGGRWREFYSQTLAESITMKQIYGDDPIYRNAFAQLEIWMVHEWARMVQIWGDMPYFGAGEGEIVQYNAEQEIYNDLFARLDAAVKILDASDSSQFSFGQDDLIFNGDIEKWKRFGNSIRLRLAMRLANVDPSKAQAEVAAAINGGVMTSNDDIAQIPIDRDRDYDYLHILTNLFQEVRVSKTFADYLYSEAGFEDPRASRWLVYNADSPLADSDRFIGVENGYDIVPEDANDAATMKTRELGGEFFGFVGDGGQIRLYMPLMYYSEVLFLQSEAALRGWIGGDANSLYQEGIQASMDLVGVEAADATAYISAIPALSGSNEVQLKQLITQKWIANFPNGTEAWADFRRTDYPDITLPIDGVSGNSTVAPDTWVKRIRYPDNAHNFESEFIPEAFNTIPKNRMDARLWWDTADTKTKSGGLMSSNF